MCKLRNNNQKTFKIRLTKKHLDILNKQSNYLGTTKTNLILLKLYLSGDMKLQETHLERAVKEIKLDPDNYNFTVVKFPMSLKMMIKDKKLYLFSINQYLSAVLYYSLEDIEKQEVWKESGEKAGKKIRKYNISKKLYSEFSGLSESLGVSRSLLFNYGFMIGLDGVSDFDLSNYKKDRISTGVELTHSSIEKLDSYIPNKRGDIANQVLGNVQIALWQGKKLK